MRRIRGEPWIRVSRDGADHGISYTKLTTLHDMVEAVWSQGITRRSVDRSRATDVGSAGPADTHSNRQHGQFECMKRRWRLPWFAEDDGSVIEPRTEHLDNAGLQAGLVLWESFTSEEGWEPPALQGAASVESRALDVNFLVMEAIASTVGCVCRERPTSDGHL